MSTHREALQDIVKVCRDSSDFSRRTQTILNTALVALGYTEGQRADIFIKCAQRSEAYKQEMRTDGVAKAKKTLSEAILTDTGECRVKINKRVLEQYIN